MPRDDDDTNISKTTARNIFDRINEHGERIVSLEVNVKNISDVLKEFVTETKAMRAEQKVERDAILAELSDTRTLKRISWIVIGAVVTIITGAVFWAAFSQRFSPDSSAAHGDK